MLLTIENIEKLRGKYGLIDCIRAIEDVLIESYRSSDSAIQLYNFREVNKVDKEFLVSYLADYGWLIVFDDAENNCVPYIKRSNG